MNGPIVQSAINFSEGVHLDTIQAIVHAARSVERVIVADWSADADHNRMVLTLLGGPAAIHHAFMAAAQVAVERIDLRMHSGVHPRLGAVDVVPFAPIRDVSMEECVQLSRRVAIDFAQTLHVPVYLYERSAVHSHRTALPDIRRGGFESLFEGELTGHRAPDFGPHHPHPSAGATVMGARRPLVAYNIDLQSDDVNVAREIAAQIRSERATQPSLTGVRALGLLLTSQNRAQVSMNLTRPEGATMVAVFDYVRAAAEQRGVSVWRSEVIGLIPRAALAGEPPTRILWTDYRQTQVLEHWLD